MVVNKAGKNSIISDFLKYTESNEPNISCMKFIDELEEIFIEEKENINLHSINELLNYISRQCSFWSSSWYFSKAKFPAINAKNESEQWEDLWQTYASILTKAQPMQTELPEILQRRHNLVTLADSLERRVEINEANIFEKYSALSYSKVSFFLNKIGLRAIAENLQIKALFPKDSVGRMK